MAVVGLVMANLLSDGCGHPANGPPPLLMGGGPVSLRMVAPALTMAYLLDISNNGPGNSPSPLLMDDMVIVRLLDDVDRQPGNSPPPGYLR